MQAGAHRGRDGSGKKRFANAALGHQFMRQFEYETGAQPYSDDDGLTSIVFDGMLHDIELLRRDLGLAENGTEDDAALFLIAYRKYGPECASRLSGIFAAAIWDDRDNSLYLARDCFGVKPLFYARWQDTLVFASELTQIIALPEFSRRPNPLMVADYLAGDTDLSEHSFFADVDRLAPGCWGRFANGQLTIRRYWELDPSIHTHFKSDAEYGERFKELFIASVRRNLRTDLPVGSNLSGGLDSSSIVCVTDMIRKEQGPSAPFDTFSLSFDDRMVDEGEHVEAVCNKANIKHHAYRSDAENVFDHIPMVQKIQGEPMRSLGIVLFWRLKELAAESGMRVLLNGMGADEVLGGINLYYLADLLRTGRFRTLHRSLDRLVEYDPYSVGLSRKGLLRVFALRPLMPPWIRRIRRKIRGVSGYPSEINPDFASRVGLADRLIRIPETPFPDVYRRMSFEGFRKSYTPLLLHYEDTNNAHLGLESRFPFLDRELVEFLFSLPRQQKARDGLAKVVLRNGMNGILPDSVRNRVDKGFIDRRVDHWLGHEHKDMVERILWGDRLADTGWYDIDRLRQIYREYQGGANYRLTIWKAFNIGIWLDTFFD